jgi:hypothetical protein
MRGIETVAARAVPTSPRRGEVKIALTLALPGKTLVEGAKIDRHSLMRPVKPGNDGGGKR